MANNGPLQILHISCPLGVNQELNASLLVYDYPSAQYAPCSDWEGNMALGGAVGGIMASTPIFFDLLVPADASSSQEFG